MYTGTFEDRIHNGYQVELTVNCQIFPECCERPAELPRLECAWGQQLQYWDSNYTAGRY